jgi:chemotaxis protein methyltransferase CheR
MLSPHAFTAVTDLFHRVSGIRLTEAKRPLVSGRLQKLAQASGTDDLDRYIERLLHDNDPEELVHVVDKLTTNETYFFREPQHFDFLCTYLDEHLAARPAGRGELRVWSAASSSGEEAYSIAMLLAERLGLQGAHGWQVIGTDLSTAMVAHAQRALYPLERARDVPGDWLKRWCLRGEGEYAGKLLIKRDLRQKVHFRGANLTQALPDIGLFDIIFLRNVLIYFDNAGKADIITRVLARLKPDGRLLTGHAESIANLGVAVKALGPAVYGHG